MPKTILSVSIASCALIASAFLMAGAVQGFKTEGRILTVRGAAEIPVMADIATWTLSFVATADTLSTAQSSFKVQEAAVRSFLKSMGLSEEDITAAPLSVNDAEADRYNDRRTGPRFTISGGVVVRTDNLEAVAKAKNNLQKVLESGVVVTNSWGPNYAFTRLNDKKPELVSESARAARTAADQFAKDSGVKITGIAKAYQGNVQILGRDDFAGESEQKHKILRVVTTIDYVIK